MRSYYLSGASVFSKCVQVQVQCKGRLTCMFLRSPTTSPFGPTTRLPLSVIRSPSNRPSTRSSRVNSNSPFIRRLSATIDSGFCKHRKTRHNQTPCIQTHDHSNSEQSDKKAKEKKSKSKATKIKMRNKSTAITLKLKIELKTSIRNTEEGSACRSYCLYY